MSHPPHRFRNEGWIDRINDAFEAFVLELFCEDNGDSFLAIEDFFHDTARYYNNKDITEKGGERGRGRLVYVDSTSFHM